MPMNICTFLEKSLRDIFERDIKYPVPSFYCKYLISFISCSFVYIKHICKIFRTDNTYFLRNSNALKNDFKNLSNNEINSKNSNNLKSPP